MVALTSAVESILDGIERVPGNPWVFTGTQPGRRLMTLKSTWQRVQRRADLEGVRLHDLRHSYASRALALGESLPMIGKLLNQVQIQTTARYTHLMLDAEKAAAARVGGHYRRARRRTSQRVEGTARTNHAMAKLKVRTISNRTVEALEAHKDTVFWDRDLTGFGVRVYASGAKVYLVQTRGPNGTKRVTLGRHGVLGAEKARRQGALAIARIKAGEDPVPERAAARRAGAGPTVSEAAARYMQEHVAVRCKPATAKIRRNAIRNHIVPRLGKLPLAAGRAWTTLSTCTTGCPTYPCRRISW